MAQKRTRSGWNERRKRGGKKKIAGINENSETGKRKREPGGRTHERTSRHRAGISSVNVFGHVRHRLMLAMSSYRHDIQLPFPYTAFTTAT